MVVINDNARPHAIGSEVSSLTDQMMMFLPRRLAIRYLLARERGHRHEFFHADVIYLTEFLNGVYELLLLRRTLSLGQTLDDDHSLNFDESRGDRRHSKEA